VGILFGSFYAQFPPLLLIGVGHFLCLFVLVGALLRELVEETNQRYKHQIKFLLLVKLSKTEAVYFNLAFAGRGRVVSVYFIGLIECYTLLHTAILWIATEGEQAQHGR
jgi:hypothetical protein